MTSPNIEAGSLTTVANWSSTASHTITIPNASAGDLIVCVIGYEVNGAGPSPPIGSVVGGTLGAFTFLTAFRAGLTNDPRIEVWYKQSPGALVAETITVTAISAIDDGCLIAFGVQNCTVPPNAFDPNMLLPATGFGAATATPPTNPFNTSNANDLLFAIQCGDKAASGGTAPAGWVQQASITNPGGINFCGLGLFTQSVSALQVGVVFQAAGGSPVSNTVVLAHAFQNNGVVPPPPPPNCRYKGIKDLFLSTFTTTYLPINGVGAGWTWSPNSLHPMEFQGWTDANTNPTAARAKILDFKKGVTDIEMGPIGIGTASPNASFGFPPLAYDGKNLLGVVCGAYGGKLTGYFLKYAAPLDGLTHAYPWVLTGPALQLPNAANTQVFGLNDGMNWIMNDAGGLTAEIYESFESGLVDFQVFWDGVTIGDISLNNTPTHFAPLNNIVQFSCACPLPNGGATVWLDNVAGGAIVTSAYVADFVQPLKSVNLLMENPQASTLDIQAEFKLATNNQFWSATYGGFLKFYDDTQTFDGVVMNGYGILISADLTEYTILNIVPQDPTAANWNSTAAVKFGKIDPSGRIWMNQPNFPAVILSGVVKDNKIVSFVPPVHIPINDGLYK